MDLRHRAVRLAITSYEDISTMVYRCFKNQRYYALAG